MKKIKVLILCGSLKIGGAEKVAQSIALHAPEGLYEFHYVTFDPHVGEYEAALLEKGCVIHRMEEPSNSYPRFLRSLITLLKKERYHVIHAHTMFSCGWMMLCAKLTGVPVRISHAHSALITKKSFLKSAYETVMRLLILSCSTDLVACGIQAGQRLFGKRAFEKQGQLILNGISIPRFRFCEEQRNSIRSALGLENAFLIGHSGHLSEVKNQAFLIRLMPHILSMQPDAALLLLGEGEDRPMLEELIRETGLQNRVIMTGNVSNVPDYLSAMDVFVFPSLFEGMPLSILEVQANGLPCVISDTVPDDVFLTDLIHPLSLKDNPSDWCSTILHTRRNDPEHYAHQLQNSPFSVEHAMEKIYSIYQKGSSHD